MEYKNTLCGQNGEFWYVKTSVHIELLGFKRLKDQYRSFQKMESVSNNIIDLK
jgi:hypothetical protein